MGRARALGAVVVLLGALGLTFAAPAAALGAPIVSTGGHSAISTSSESVFGTVNPNGHVTTYDFEWGLTTAYENGPTAPQSLAKGTSPVDVSAEFDNLQPNTTYHYHLVAHNSSGDGDGGDATFTTSSAGHAPNVGVGGASGISTTGATISGTVDPRGATTTYHFEYGATTAYGQSTGPHNAGGGNGPVGVSASLTGLQPGTIYHYRLVASNSVGNASSGDASFSTAAVAAKPAASTGGAIQVAATSAVLTATVNPGGLTTTVTFEYGATSAYGNTTTAHGIGSGTADVPVAATITGLTPNTTYHYRVIASSAAGVLTGSDVALTTADTASTSASPPPSGSPAPTSGFVNVTGKNSTSAAAIATGTHGAPSPSSTLINANANTTSHKTLSAGSLGVFLAIAAVIVIALVVLSGYFVVTTGRKQESES